MARGGTRSGGPPRRMMTRSRSPAPPSLSAAAAGTSSAESEEENDKNNPDDNASASGGGGSDSDSVPAGDDSKDSVGATEAPPPPRRRRRATTATRSSARPAVATAKAKRTAAKRKVANAPSTRKSTRGTKRGREREEDDGDNEVQDDDNGNETDGSSSHEKDNESDKADGEANAVEGTKKPSSRPRRRSKKDKADEKSEKVILEPKPEEGEASASVKEREPDDDEVESGGDLETVAEQTKDEKDDSDVAENAPGDPDKDPLPDEDEVSGKRTTRSGSKRKNSSMPVRSSKRTRKNDEEAQDSDDSDDSAKEPGDKEEPQADASQDDETTREDGLLTVEDEVAPDVEEKIDSVGYPEPDISADGVEVQHRIDEAEASQGEVEPAMDARLALKSSHADGLEPKSSDTAVATDSLLNVPIPRKATRRSSNMLDHEAEQLADTASGKASTPAGKANQITESCAFEGETPATDTIPHASENVDKVNIGHSHGDLNDELKTKAVATGASSSHDLPENANPEQTESVASLNSPDAPAASGSSGDEKISHATESPDTRLTQVSPDTNAVRNERANDESSAEGGQTSELHHSSYGAHCGDIAVPPVPEEAAGLPPFDQGHDHKAPTLEREETVEFQTEAEKDRVVDDSQSARDALQHKWDTDDKNADLSTTRPSVREQNAGSDTRSADVTEHVSKDSRSLDPSQPLHGKTDVPEGALIIGRKHPVAKTDIDTPQLSSDGVEITHRDVSVEALVNSRISGACSTDVATGDSTLIESGNVADAAASKNDVIGENVPSSSVMASLNDGGDSVVLSERDTVGVVGDPREESVTGWDEGQKVEGVSVSDSAAMRHVESIPIVVQEARSSPDQNEMTEGAVRLEKAVEAVGERPSLSSEVRQHDLSQTVDSTASEHETILVSREASVNQLTESECLPDTLQSSPVSASRSGLESDGTRNEAAYPEISGSILEDKLCLDPLDSILRPTWLCGSDEHDGSFQVSQAKPKQLSLERVKLALFSTGNRVHGSPGYARRFAEYWSSLAVVIHSDPSDPNLRKHRSIINSFLTSRKLRKLHNRLVLGLLEVCYLPSPGSAKDVKATASTSGSSRPTLSLQLLDSSGGRKDYLHYASGEDQGASRSAGASPFCPPYPTLITKPRSKTLVPKVYPVKSSFRVPGAMAVDPYVRTLAAATSMKVSENAVWLLVVAMREFVEAALKNCIQMKNSIEAGSIPPVPHLRQRVLHKKRDIGEHKIDSYPLSSSPQPGGTCITALDVYALAASMSMGPARAIGGTISRQAFELTQSSSFGTIAQPEAAAFDLLKDFITSKVSPPLTMEVQYEESSPALLAKQQWSQGSETSTDAPAEPPKDVTRNRSVHAGGGLGRGAKDLGALRARSLTQRNAATTVATSAAIVTGPSHPTAPRPAETFEGAVKSQTPRGSPALGAGASASSSNTVDVESLQPAAQTANVARRGKGFGVKNLAAMRARSVTKPADGEEDADKTNVNPGASPREHDDQTQSHGGSADDADS